MLLANAEAIASQITATLKDRGIECAACGSLSLAKSGLLKREIRDIDLITKGTINDAKLLDWAEKNGRWAEMNKQPAQSLENGTLSFFVTSQSLKKQAKRDRREPSEPEIKVEIFLPGRLGIETMQVRDCVDFTYREIDWHPPDGTLPRLSSDACIFWKAWMARPHDETDLKQIRELAFGANLRLQLNEIEELLVNARGPRHRSVAMFQRVFRPTSLFEFSSSNAAGHRVFEKVGR